MSKFSLDKKNALITGAAGLLGLEHAAALLEVGATVILTDISVSRLCTAKEILAKQFLNEKIHFFEMDVTSPISIRRLFNQLANADIYVDILINNAAIDPKVKDDGDLAEASRLENFPITAWDLQISVGLTGAFLCSQTFGARMAETGNGGVILNIASDLSVIAPDQRIYRQPLLNEGSQPVKPITYSVIKAGLIGLTKYLASYWAKQGVRCNALSPGGVYHGQDPEFVQKLISLIPLERMADPNEYRSAVQFLCSDASRYMTGQNIIIDGGRTII